MSPTGKKPNRAGFKISLRLYEYELRIGTNRCCRQCRLQRQSAKSEIFQSRCGLLCRQRSGMKFLEYAPVFAAEVRSENDYGLVAEREIKEKIADYFAAGTLVVWDVDLLGQDVIRAYRADNPHQPDIYRRGEIANAEPALSGWMMAVDDLFQ